MWFDYHCMNCEHEFEVELPSAERNDSQNCPECRMNGAVRVLDFTSLTIGVPKRLHTSFDMVHGAPGSPQREQFEKDAKEGKVVYAGPGSRWV